MSLDKFKAGSSDQLCSLKQKLSTVDRHIRRSQNLPATLFMQPQLLQYLTKQSLPLAQPNNEIKLGDIKPILFNEKTSLRFFFSYVPLSEQRRYVFKIEPSKIDLEVFVQLDGGRKVGYRVASAKGILIQDVGWRRVEFTLVARRKEKLSTVKIEINTIVVDHKVKVHGVPSQKKAVQKQLKEYLKNNLTKQKIAAILQKRRRKSLTLTRTMTRAKTFSAQSTTKSIECHEISRIFRSTNGFNQSTSIIKSRSPVYTEQRIQSTQMKRDLNYFQDSKQKYLRHIKKMEPEKAQAIIQYQKKYSELKEQSLKATSSSCFAILFSHHMIKLSILVHRKKLKKIQSLLLCKKFYKNLQHANKMRLGFRARNKSSIQLNLSAIACCLFQESTKKAEERLMARFRVTLFMLDVEKIMDMSEVYTRSVVAVQRKFRLDNGFYRMRFEVMAKRIKGYTFEKQEDFEDIFRKYKRFCYTKSKKLKFGFTKYHNHIDQLMKQKMALQYKF